MDKSDAVALLKTNKAEFQRLRDEDSKADLDLSGVDLSGCDLTGAALAGVVLRGACLRGADCRKANFRHSDLAGADLRDTNLDGANLHHVNLEGANLEGADLGGADRSTRFCLHTSAFRGTRWSRGELEKMLAILNENQGWEIRYQLVPKAGV